ncbi:MAG: hypothetical protein OXI67_11460 [Candidatus Poribacteria bacterium]|nr:hypothetical protein [Candidatus Poribacteria bacterium]
MKKLNQFLNFTFLVLLFTSPLLVGCGEGEREIMFPDLPQSVTVKIEDVPEGAMFKLNIPTDPTAYSKHKNNLDETVIAYNDTEEYTVKQTFNKTFPLETEKPNFVLDLICTYVDPISENSSNSIGLTVQFNGEGSFNKGNHSKVYPFEVGTTIIVVSTFSQYDGISSFVRCFTPPSGPHPYQ